LQEYTLEELAIEYLEHRIDEDPSEAHPRIEEGENVAFVTRDPVINALERKVVKEGVIDVDDVLSTFSEEDRVRLARRFGKKKPKEAVPDLPESFSDRYDDNGPAR
jgi:hypothetical protein